mmetsp:Transcript_8208/g.12353  ORF Transcript_8208/g.12353 Transcript_8208/m.12353 type:complete len:201 (+) Transcript_8208:645-1247(+)
MFLNLNFCDERLSLSHSRIASKSHNLPNLWKTILRKTLDADTNVISCLSLCHLTVVSLNREYLCFKTRRVESDRVSRNTCLSLNFFLKNSLFNTSSNDSTSLHLVYTRNWKTKKLVKLTSYRLYELVKSFEEGLSFVFVFVWSSSSPSLEPRHLGRSFDEVVSSPSRDRDNRNKVRSFLLSLCWLSIGLPARLLKHLKHV